MKLDARQNLFLWLVGVFLTCLIVGNLIGGKLTSVHVLGRDWVISVGEIPFPLTFILTDIINEFYGRRTARKVTLLAFAMTGLVVLIIQLANQVPWAPFAQGPEWAADGNMTPSGFDNVFMSATLIQVASMVAFLTAQYVDIGAFFLIKRLTGKRLLWLRATGSTAISQLVDTVVILAIAFGSKLDTSTLVTMMITSYVVKVAVAIGVTPIIYALHGMLERIWHLTPLASADAEEAAERGPLPDAVVK